MRLRVILFTALATMAVAVLAWGVEPYNTSGRWACMSGTCVVGHAQADAIQLLTDSTGDAEIVLPNDAIGAAEITENAVAAEQLGAAVDKIVLCGQDANSGTIYFGPSTAAYLGGGGEQAIGGAACNALDSATETTADAPITAGFPAFKVLGMHCISSSDAANDQVLTLRSAAADVTPSVTCTIAGTGTATECTSTTATTTDIAAGATIAVKSVNTEDLSAQDVWCQVYFSF